MLLLLAAGTMLMDSCIKIIDWGPINVEVSIQDASGKDLLDPFDSAFAGYEVDIEHRGETYHLDSAWVKKYMDFIGRDQSGKYYMPTFFGWVLSGNPTTGYYLCYGELDGDSDFDDDFVVKFSDGRSETIHFKRKHRGQTHVKDTWKLNGKEVSDNCCHMFVFEL